MKNLCFKYTNPSSFRLEPCYNIKSIIIHLNNRSASTDNLHLTSTAVRRSSPNVVAKQANSNY